MNTGPDNHPQTAATPAAAPGSNRKWKKISIWTATGFLIVLFGLQILLQFRLTELVRKFAFPEVEKLIETRLELDKLSVNLLAGSMHMSGLRILNPEGFDEPHLFTLDRHTASLHTPSLFMGVIRIPEVHIQQAGLNIIRNTNGVVNLLKLQESLARNTQSTGKTEKAETELPKFILEKLTLLSQFEYIDHTVGDEPATLSLTMEISAQTITTFEVSGMEQGTFSIHAYRTDKTNQFVTRLQGTIAPVLDPMKATFKVEGTIGAIDLTDKEKLARELGIMSDSIAVEVGIECRDGNFVRGKSGIVLRIKNAKLLGKVAEKTKNMPIPSDLVLPVPLVGSLENPSVDIPGALMNAIIGNIKTIDQSKINRGLNRLFGKIIPGKKKNQEDAGTD